MHAERLHLYQLNYISDDFIKMFNSEFIIVIKIEVKTSHITQTVSIPSTQKPSSYVSLFFNVII